MNTPTISDENWHALTSKFTLDLDQTAGSLGALQRKRKIASGDVLLRLCLLYGFCCFSLREAACRAGLAELVDLADVSLLERLERCGPWLEALLCNLLAQRASEQLARPLPRLQVCIVDATVITIPGSKGTDWRVHLGLDLARQRIDSVEVTDAHGGESLRRFAPAPAERASGGKLLIGDRAYGKGIFAGISSGHEVLTRITWQNLPLMSPDGAVLEPLACCRDMQEGQVWEFDVLTQPTAEVPAVPGRFIVVRKTDAARDEAIRRLKKERKHGRAPSKETLEACAYIFMFTSLPREQASAEEVAQMYRLRWQIEIAFKRMKQVQKLGHMNAKKPALCRVALLSKLIGILLTEETVEKWGDFSPWQLEGELVSDDPDCHLLDGPMDGSLQTELEPDPGRLHPKATQGHNTQQSQTTPTSRQTRSHIGNQLCLT